MPLELIVAHHSEHHPQNFINLFACKSDQSQLSPNLQFFL